MLGILLAVAPIAGLLTFLEPALAQTGFQQAADNVTLSGPTVTYFRLNQADWRQCETACGQNGACQSFTYVKPGGYKAGDPPMCYLIGKPTSQTSYPCCISGLKDGVTIGGNAGGGTASGGPLSGTWALRCCNDELQWVLTIDQENANTFSGSFSDNNGSGTVKNGRLSGNTVEFDRIGTWGEQHWKATLANGRGGGWQMINGVWTGVYHEIWVTNWHAEKK